MQTESELREYEFETGQHLLDESVTGRDLLIHNDNIKHGRMRAQDEHIDALVRGLADKTNIKQRLDGRHTFAMRLHGRRYPDNLKQPAIERLMAKYDKD